MFDISHLKSLHKPFITLGDASTEMFIHFCGALLSMSVFIS